MGDLIDEGGGSGYLWVNEKSEKKKKLVELILAKYSGYFITAVDR